LWTVTDPVKGQIMKPTRILNTLIIKRGIKTRAVNKTALFV